MSQLQVKPIIFATLIFLFGSVVGYKMQTIGGWKQFSQSPTSLFKVVKTEQPAEFKQVDFSQFWDVWTLLQKNYLDQDKLKQDKMVYGAIKGMTSSLGDPYTYFLEPTEQKRTEEDLGGSFFGVGIQLGYIDQVLAVSTPIKGSPAERAGIKAKDLILKVKDEKTGKEEDTSGWTLPEAVDKIRGEKGTSVTLTMYRKDDKDKPEPFPVTLVRDEIVVPSVEVKMIDKDNKKIAHITLTRFGDRTETELNEVIRQITTSTPKVNGIVLDMRNNPGGYLNGAVEVAGEFMNRGTLVVTQKGTYAEEPYTTKGNARLQAYPIVVLVNGGSASAAEIVAGALRDQKQAELVGEKTFGKGTVQDALKLDNGAGLHVTIARWIMPKGDWINEKGIPVNVEVKDDSKTADVDEQFDKAVEELLKKI